MMSEVVLSKTRSEKERWTKSSDVALRHRLKKTTARKVAPRTRIKLLKCYALLGFRESVVTTMTAAAKRANMSANTVAKPTVDMQMPLSLKSAVIAATPYSPFAGR